MAAEAARSQFENDFKNKTPAVEEWQRQQEEDRKREDVRQQLQIAMEFIRDLQNQNHELVEVYEEKVKAAKDETKAVRNDLNAAIDEKEAARTQLNAAIDEKEAAIDENKVLHKKVEALQNMLKKINQFTAADSIERATS